MIVYEFYLYNRGLWDEYISQFLWLTYVIVRQKPTQICKAIILQLKIKCKKKKKTDY